MAVPDQAFGGESNKGAQKNLHVFKYPSFSATIVGVSYKVITFSRANKMAIFLVELYDLQGITTVLNRLLSLIHKKFEAGPKR